MSYARTAVVRAIALHWRRAARRRRRRRAFRDSMRTAPMAMLTDKAYAEDRYVRLMREVYAPHALGDTAPRPLKAQATNTRTGQPVSHRRMIFFVITALATTPAWRRLQAPEDVPFYEEVCRRVRRMLRGIGPAGSNEQAVLADIQRLAALHYCETHHKGPAGVVRQVHGGDAELGPDAPA